MTSFFARALALALVPAGVDALRLLTHSPNSSGPLGAYRAAQMLPLLFLLYLLPTAAALAGTTAVCSALRRTGAIPSQVRPLLEHPWILTVSPMVVIVARDLLRAVFAIPWEGPARWISWGVALIGTIALMWLLLLAAPLLSPRRWRFNRLTLDGLALLLLTGAVAMALPRLLGQGWQPAPKPAATSPRGLPDILLLTVDTLNPFHLPLYGYTRPTAPNMDRLAGEGTLFQRTYSVASITTPSLVSLFTGSFPTEHGVLGFYPLPKWRATLPEALGSAGYQTGAMVGWSAAAQRVSGLAQAFQQYRELPDEPVGSVLYRSLVDYAPHGSSLFAERMALFLLKPYRATARVGLFEADAATMTGAAIQWLGRVTPSPYFLWVHYVDPHSPYRPTEGRGLFTGDPNHPVYSFDWDKENALDFLPSLASAYDEEISFADAEIGRLLAYARELHRERPLLVVLLGDHGERFAPPRPGHDPYLTEDVIRIPLIILDPQRSQRGATSDALVQTADIAPSILARLGLPVPPGMTGLPLAAIAGEGVTRHQVWALNWEVPALDLTPQSGRQAAIWQDDWKLIETLATGERRLYNLAMDPQERVNLAGRNAPMEHRLAEALEAWLRSSAIALRASDLDLGALRPPPGLDY